MHFPYLGRKSFFILGSRKNITYSPSSFMHPVRERFTNSVCSSFFCVTKILITRRGNSVFCALKKNKLKLLFWVSYLFPTPLSRWTDITYTFYDGLFFYHISLKMLAIATAISVLFASSDRKIASVKNDDYLTLTT